MLFSFDIEIDVIDTVLYTTISWKKIPDNLNLPQLFFVQIIP